MKDFIKKLTSRKFILAAIGIASGFTLQFVGSGNMWQEIIGSAVAVVCALVYMIVEGKIDAESVKSVSENTVNILKHAKASKDVIDTAEKIGDIAEEMADKMDGDN